jgi:hypothetical protein
MFNQEQIFAIFFSLSALFEDVATVVSPNKAVQESM